MKKNTRTLMITLLSFIVIIVVASIAYNALKETSAPAVSLTPNLQNLPASMEQAPTTVTPQVEAEETETTIAAVQVVTPIEDGEAVDAEPVESPPVASSSEAGTEAPVEEAPKMPDIPFFTLAGEETSFETIRQGKPAIINYFASWCPPCKQELPHFQKAYDTYGEDISFIFLNAMDGQRETMETITAFIEEFPFTGPVYTDEGIFAYIFQTNSLPTTVFFNADGTIANGYLGYVSETALQENIDQLLTQE